ncbi:MAG: diheme cytochrome c [Azoarcus sp.]|jgi:nitrate/TMAO reductase-like tetraheme cytochrome c subunit|nr:diheme cytochrome c [Azoarcus sp.]
MKQTLRRLSCLSLLLLSASSYAGDHQYLRMGMPEAYAQECVGCHVAYPPKMLSAKSWQRMMSNLGQHYGTDARLAPEKARQIEAWLVDYAARKGRRAYEMPPEDRITQTRWFVKEHRHVAPPVWRLESVKSAANCQACHSLAEQGRYDDDELVVPKGVTPAQMRAFLD